MTTVGVMNFIDNRMTGGLEIVDNGRNVVCGQRILLGFEVPLTCEAEQAGQSLGLWSKPFGIGNSAKLMEPSESLGHQLPGLIRLLIPLGRGSWGARSVAALRNSVPRGLSTILSTFRWKFSFSYEGANIYRMVICNEDAVSLGRKRNGDSAPTRLVSFRETRSPDLEGLLIDRSESGPGFSFSFRFRDSKTKLISTASSTRKGNIALTLRWSRKFLTRHFPTEVKNRFESPLTRALSFVVVLHPR